MFTFIKKLVLLAVLAFGAGIAGKIYLEMKMQERLDSYIAAAAPFAKIEYQGINLDRDGGVNIQGLMVSPVLSGNGTNSIANLRLSSADRWFFIAMTLGFADEKIPESLSVALEEVELGILSSQYLASLMAEINSEFSAQVAPSCGEVQYLSAPDWNQMGYGRLAFDMTFNYDYSSIRSALEFSVETNSPDMGDARIKFILGGIPMLTPAVAMSASNPSLQLVEVDYTDLGYTRRMVSYCSKKMNMSVVDFIDREVGREDEYYLAAWGVVPGIAIKEAYREYLLKPKSVNFAMYPSEDFQFADLFLYAAKDWANLLKMSLLVNDRAITPLELSRKVGGVAPVEVDVPVEAVSTEMEFEEVNKKELGNYIGHEVRVHSINGRVREGVLEAIRDGNIEMINNAYGQEIGISVSVFSTERVEVYKLVSGK